MSSADNIGKSQEDALTARKATEAAEKAEFRQALMSLYIPLSLFVACCVFAAGAFMVYYEEPAGWAFIGTTVLLAISAFIALFKFQNKFRARGIIPAKDAIVESNIVDARPEVSSKQDLDQIVSTTATCSETASPKLPDTTSDARPAPPRFDLQPSPVGKATSDRKITAAK